jgi:hypothetical protein
VLSSSTLLGSGHTLLSDSVLPKLAVGSHSITAVHSGDIDFVTSTSKAVGEKVSKASTKTTLSSSANPSSVGQSVTFTAIIGVVASGAGTPTGTIRFKDGNTVLGTVTLQVVNGVVQATFTTAGLKKGKHTITAVYSGDADFLGNTSASLTQTVQ